MILVREVFQAKWGKANDVVALLRDEIGSIPTAPQAGLRILTDLSGEFDTVVLESRYESLAEWEQVRARLFASPEFQQGAAGLGALVVSGRQEYYTIEVER